MEMYVFDFVMPSAQKMSCIFMVVQTNEKKSQFIIEQQ